MYSDLIGIPFARMNCWDLAREVFSRHGIEIEGYAISPDDTSRIGAEYMRGMAEAKAGLGKWVELSSPEIPCLVAIRNHPVFVAHCGVYIGAGKFIHALEDSGVVVSTVSDPRWRRKIVGYYRHK